MKNKLLLLLTLCVFSQLPNETWANRRLLSLSQWKSQQKLEAQNRITRISNQIIHVKSTSGNLEEIYRLEAEKRVAAQGLDYVNGLDVEDYFNVYLTQYANNDKLVAEAARKLSRKEMAKLLKSLIKSKSAAYSYNEPAGQIPSNSEESL